MYRISFGLVFSLCFVGLVHCQNTVTISLYYESMCPASIQFVSQQLYPVYLEMGKYLQLHLVPYGKAKQNKEDDKWVFRCQHGQDECHGNKVQACALATNSSMLQKIRFIKCGMEEINGWSSSIIRQCADRASMRWDEISDCAGSDSGDQLLAQYGEETKALRPSLTHVPWILFNGVYSKTMNNIGELSLRRVVCRLLSNKPLGCN